MSKDHVVSFRLTEAERRQLAQRACRARCSVSDIVRAAALGALLAEPSATQESMSLTVAADSHLVWHDGTVGPTWPSLATG